VIHGLMSVGKLCCDDANARLIAPTCLDDDLDVASERVEEAKESIGGEAGQLAAKEGGHFGLVYAQELRRLGLAQAFFLDDEGDLEREA
jgi:hypothetical protein